ncbi:hypothetical protein JCM10213v2_007761 [Rhodosporidiobolus nylandii]
MDGEDAELGRLFVPCQCKGTAKFVHEECLRQWRTKDESMAFFICGMCGSRYRLRKRWHLVVAFHRATVPALTVLLAFAVSTLAGFLAPPLMRWVSRYFYVPDRAAPLREWALTDLLTLGDAVREPVSAFGSLVGDCRWAAGRELHWEDITTPEQKAQGTTMSAVLDRGITACGRRWGVERDEYVAGSSGTRAGMHLTAGAALVGVGWVLVSQLALRWYLLVRGVRYVNRRWADKLRSRWVEESGVLMPCAVYTILNHLRPFVKRARAADKLFSWSQGLFLLAHKEGTQITAFSIIYILFQLRSLVRRLIILQAKRAKGLVLDIRDVEAAAVGKRRE